MTVKIRRKKPLHAIAADLIINKKVKETHAEEHSEEEHFEEPPLTRVEALVEAVSWLEPVIDSLNIQQTKCDCCGSKSYEDWFEYQTFQKLTGVQDKLRGIIKQLEKRHLDHEVG